MFFVWASGDVPFAVDPHSRNRVDEDL